MDSRLVALLCLAAIFGGLECACPEHCNCLPGDYVHCAYLDRFPMELPKTTLYVNVTLMDISEIPSDAFRETPNIRNITISFSKIGSISSCAFRGLRELKWLTMNSTDIGTINSLAFNDLQDVEMLRISYSKISVIDKFAFHNLRNIQDMELFASGIGRIEPLAYYNIGANRFSLWWLDVAMQNNAMAVSSIKYLEIYESNFRNLHCGTIDVMKAHLSQNFTFRSNSLTCDCEISWMLEPAMKTLLGEALLGQANCNNLSPPASLKDLEPIDRHCASYSGKTCPGVSVDTMKPPCLQVSDAVWVVQNNVCLMFALFCSFLVRAFRTGL